MHALDSRMWLDSSAACKGPTAFDASDWLMFHLRALTTEDRLDVTNCWSFSLAVSLCALVATLTVAGLTHLNGGSIKNKYW